MKRYGLIGYPLSHSFSGKYFNAKFEKEGLADHLFELFEIDHISKLVSEVLPNHPDLLGFAITIPYKKEVIQYLDDRSALHLDACNCVKITNGKLKGYNTDVIGFEQSLKALLKPEHSPALVLGTGGAAEGVKYVLDKMGIPFTSGSRSSNPNTVTYAEMDEAFIARHKLIINTTPLGTTPNVEDCAPIPYEGIGPDHYLFDLVYNPLETKFLRLGRERGAQIKNGADMFEIQAEANWNIWNED